MIFFFFKFYVSALQNFTMHRKRKNFPIKLFLHDFRWKGSLLTWTGDALGLVGALAHVAIVTGRTGVDVPVRGGGRAEVAGWTRVVPVADRSEWTPEAWTETVRNYLQNNL